MITTLRVLMAVGMGVALVVPAATASADAPAGRRVRVDGAQQCVELLIGEGVLGAACVTAWSGVTVSWHGASCSMSRWEGFPHGTEESSRETYAVDERDAPGATHVRDVDRSGTGCLLTRVEALPQPWWTIGRSGWMVLTAL